MRSGFSLDGQGFSGESPSGEESVARSPGPSSGMGEERSARSAGKPSTYSEDDCPPAAGNEFRSGSVAGSSTEPLAGSSRWSVVAARYDVLAPSRAGFPSLSVGRVGGTVLDGPATPFSRRSSSLKRGKSARRSLTMRSMATRAGSIVMPRCCSYRLFDAGPRARKPISPIRIMTNWADRATRKSMAV